MIKAKSTILHSGIEYKAGDVLPSNLTSAQIKQLVDSGACEVVVDEQVKPVVAKTAKADKKVDGKTPYQALQDEAKALGLKYVGVKADKLKEMVEAAKAGNPKKEVSKEPSAEWGKTRLLGEARKRGIKADETMTVPELLDAIAKAEPAKDEDGDPADVPAVTRTSVPSQDVPAAPEK